jgi:hypothetical protein
VCYVSGASPALAAPLQALWLSHAMLNRPSAGAAAVSATLGLDGVHLAVIESPPAACPAAVHLWQPLWKVAILLQLQRCKSTDVTSVSTNSGDSNSDNL